LRDGSLCGAIHAMKGTPESGEDAAEQAARPNSVVNPCPCSAAAIRWLRFHARVRWCRAPPTPMTAALSRRRTVHYPRPSVSKRSAARSSHSCVVPGSVWRPAGSYHHPGRVAEDDNSSARSLDGSGRRRSSRSVKTRSKTCIIAKASVRKSCNPGCTSTSPATIRPRLARKAGRHALAFAPSASARASVAGAPAGDDVRALSRAGRGRPQSRGKRARVIRRAGRLRVVRRSRAGPDSRPARLPWNPEAGVRLTLPHDALGMLVFEGFPNRSYRWTVMPPVAFLPATRQGGERDASVAYGLSRSVEARLDHRAAAGRADNS
jgi:hypothetical protein